MNFIVKQLKNALSVTGIANVHFFDFQKNFTTDKDKHPFCELLYVSSGSLTVESEDFNGVLHRETLLIHRANEHHKLSTHEEETRVIIIGFTCDNFNSEYFSKNPIHLNDSNVKKLAEIVKEGRNVFLPPHNVPVYDMKKNVNQPFGSEQMLKNLLEYFLISISREHLSGYLPENNAQTEFTVNEIIGYLNDKYKEKITLNELSFIFGTNRTTLCKEFKQATGTTISNYLSNKKLEEAKLLITTTNKTFTEISIELNFESIHYFTRFFKKHTSITPKEYKKQNRI